MSEGNGDICFCGDFFGYGVVLFLLWGILFYGLRKCERVLDLEDIVCKDKYSLLNSFIVVLWSDF